MSLSLAMSSSANRNALDLIIRRSELPSDLRWDEVLAFHDAVSASRRVQLDYFAFLYKAWEAAWGTAKNKLLPAAVQPTVSELIAGTEPTVDTAWDGASVLNKIDLPNGCTMWSGVESVDLSEIKLFFYLDW